jgi:multidrug efflux system membrane fusion protein
MCNPIARRRLLFVGLFSSSAILLAACNAGSGTPAATPPPTVGVATVLARPIKAWDEFNGRVSAIDSVELRPRVSGYVDRVVYKEGSEVKPGDVLFIIDPRPYRDTLNSAQAQLERVQSAAALASSKSKRAQTLIATQAISREEFDNSQSDLTQSAAEVRVAEAAVATAKRNLTFTEVRAPVAGRAGRAQLTVGNLALADQTVLTTVVSQETMHVYFDCDEHSFLRYREIARASGRRSKPYAVRVGLANEDGFPHQGSVDFTDNQLNPATGTIRVRAVIANRDRALTPGMYAHVQLQGSGEFDALLIDNKAVLTDQDRKYVYVLGGDNKALRKDIVLGRQIDGLRVVQSGLATTDKVIVSGTQKIFYAGMVVKPETIAMENPAS